MDRTSRDSSTMTAQFNWIFSVSYFEAIQTTIMEPSSANEAEIPVICERQVNSRWLFFLSLWTHYQHAEGYRNMLVPANELAE